MKIRKSGFTVVEIVIVIAVIAILAAVLIPTFAYFIGKANDAAALSELYQIQTLIETELADDNRWEFADRNDKNQTVEIIGSGEGKLWVKNAASLAEALNSCRALDGYGSFEQEELDLIYTAKSGNGKALWGNIAAYGSYGLEYGLNEDGVSYSVKSIGFCTDTDIVVPPTYNGKPVTKIGDEAFSLCPVESVKIPYGVTSIGKKAFYIASSLTSIEIPESVTTIGDEAFRMCLSLESITLQYGVTTIGNSAFCECENLGSVTIPDSVTSIGSGAFARCYELKRVIIPNGVTSIGDATFSGCNNMTSVILPQSLTSIGERAFMYCLGLTSINIPESVTDIESEAFSRTGLTSVTVPKSVMSIGSYAFSTCVDLTTVTIAEGVASIGRYAFNCCTSLKQINYSGTSHEWYAIEKAENWDRGTGEITITCAESDESLIKLANLIPE